jgi:hypothetical protein
MRTGDIAMKCVAVSLETLDPEGVEIVSDVTDSLGRLLAKAPCVLEPNLKKLLLARGVRYVYIRSCADTPRSFDNEALEKELELLKKRLILLAPHDREGDFVKMVVETVRGAYQKEEVLPEHRD